MSLALCGKGERVCGCCVSNGFSMVCVVNVTCSLPKERECVCGCCVSNGFSMVCVVNVICSLPKERESVCVDVAVSIVCMALVCADVGR